MSEEQGERPRGVTRLSFIKATGGVLAGAAGVVAPAAVANAVEPRAVAVEPQSATPREPVLAYVRDAGRGEVTVIAGTSEKTYRDRALAKRILAAAPRQHRGGGS